MGSSDFTAFGLSWVCISNVCFCLRTIQYKQVRKAHGFDDWNLFYHICRLGTICQLMYALVLDFDGLLTGVRGLLAAASRVSPFTWGTNLALVVINGCMYYTYLQFSWVILMRVPVVTHAVSNSMRRPVVLLCNVLYFKNDINLVNAMGIALAFGGVILYSRAKA